MKFSALCLLALAVPAHGIQMFGTVEELRAEYGVDVVLTGEICCDSTVEFCDGYIPDGTPAPFAPVTAAPVPTTTAPVPTTPAPVPTTPAPVPTTPAPVPTTPAPVPTTPAPVPTTPAPVPTTPAPVPTTPAPVPTTPAPVPTTPAPVPTTPAPVPGLVGNSAGSTSSPTMTPGTAAPTMGPCIEMDDVDFTTRVTDICAGWTEEFVDGVQMTDDCSDGSIPDREKGLVIDEDTDEWHASFSTGGPAMDTVKVWYSFCLADMANDGHEFNLHVTDNKGQTYHIDTVIFGDYGIGCHDAEAYGVFPMQTDTVDVAFKDHTLAGSIAIITKIKVHYCEAPPTPAPVLSPPTPGNADECPTPEEPTTLETFSGHINQDALGFQHMQCAEGLRCVGFEARSSDSASGGYSCGGTMLSNAFANPSGETGGKDFEVGDRVYCALGGDTSKIVCVSIDGVESKSGGEQTGFQMSVGCTDDGLAFDKAQGTCDTDNVIEDVGFSFVFIKGGSPCGKGKGASCPSGNDPFLDGVNCDKRCNTQDGQVYYAPGDGGGFNTFENPDGMTFYTSCSNGQITQDPDCNGGGRFGLSHMEICFAEYCPE